MHGVVFGEFMGTLVLILFGDGTVANVLLKDSKGSALTGGSNMTAPWVIIVLGWAFAVTMGITTALACGSPFAFINPAVALAVCILHPANWPIFLPCALAEIAGGFVGGVLVYLTFLQHWKDTDPTLQLCVFSTFPQIRNFAANTLTEIIATTALIVVGLGFGTKGMTGVMTGFGPFLWGLLILTIGCSLGGPTGYAMNPARDLGPRLAHLVLPIANKRDSDWGYALVPIIGPLVGACIAAGIVMGLGW
ncbi:MAG: MIP/aquaporin family protein [Terracidiphilus sp.]